MQGIGRLALPFAACALTLAFAVAAPAADTSFWRSETFEDFEAGEPSGTSILHDGTVVLSYDLEEVSIPDAQYVWAAEEHGGDLYAVAGTPGRLYRVRGGDVELLWGLDTPDLTALAVGPTGRVFVGTAPGGEVYEVQDDGSHELFFETGEGYVWAMVFSAEHGLVVGTGDSARVFVVDDDGDGEVVHESSEASVSRLAAVGGRLLAGTAVGGMLLDVTPGRDVRVLHDSRYEEVTGIAVGPDGNVYFSATGVLLEEAFGDDELDAGLGEGSVFRTTEGGGVIELWHSPDAPLTSLGTGPDGAVWAGTGSRGRVVSVGPRGRVALIADLDPEQVLSIASSEDGAIVTTGLTGSVFLSGSEAGGAGTYTSDVFDARSTARWGEISWRGETPRGSGIRISSRSGNTEVPDEAWSDWTNVSGDSEGPIESPTARFLQWRAELTAASGRATPVLRAVEVAFLRENLPPVIIGVRVSESADAFAAGGGFVGDPVTQTLSGGLEVTYSLRPDAPAPRDLPILTRGLRTAEWEAHDPNDDALSYDVWVRGEDEEAWKVLAEDLERSAHTWDTQSMPDGRYRVRVRADDGPENPADQAGSDERESAPFIVDNTPPTLTDVEISREGEGIVVGGRAGDVLSPIVRVEVAIDYGEWRSAFAEDGMFDSLEEAFDLTISGEGEGERAVTIRAIDRAGNVGTARRVVR
jgi:hypothetical protein